MQIKIKRFDKTLPLPAYKTKGAAAFDLCTRIDVVVPPNQLIIIPLNVAIQVPQGYHSLLLLRSSAQKTGIFQPSLGLIDSDYCGNNDEFRIPVVNHTAKPIIIEKGTRLAQVLIQKTLPVEIVEVDHLNNIDRGGFGTTGVK